MPSSPAAIGHHEQAADLDEELCQVLALADPQGLGGCLVFRASKGFGRDEARVEVAPGSTSSVSSDRL